ncbi:translation initiation factor 2 [Breoghania sp. L-A4]|uniref:translation initiation factor 2 n=1 Tax=Breoghania sp. L-A4 TaxID=2304600 RepID=UPI000E35ED78|nr:translation initiation factor 2 [Breoghania sp. L-A4]AXS39776.1 translation initiation factor 2 [Breoghania sp. L-A4]
MRNIHVLVALGLAVSGCATVTRGTTEEVRVVVDPADAKVETTIGLSCTGMPCNLQAKRKAEFTVTASKPGYKPESVFVSTGMSAGGAAGVAGNILIGGVIGVGVDAISGATLSHAPNPVLIALEPLDPANSATPPGDVKKLEEQEWDRKNKPQGPPMS